MGAHGGCIRKEPERSKLEGLTKHLHMKCQSSDHFNGLMVFQKLANKPQSCPRKDEKYDFLRTQKTYNLTKHIEFPRLQFC